MNSDEGSNNDSRDKETERKGRKEGKYGRTQRRKRRHRTKQGTDKKRNVIPLARKRRTTIVNQENNR